MVCHLLPPLGHVQNWFCSDRYRGNRGYYRSGRMEIESKKVTKTLVMTKSSPWLQETRLDAGENTATVEKPHMAKPLLLPSR